MISLSNTTGGLITLLDTDENEKFAIGIWPIGFVYKEDSNQVKSFETLFRKQKEAKVENALKAQNAVPNDDTKDKLTKESQKEGQKEGQKGFGKSDPFEVSFIDFSSSEESSFSSEESSSPNPPKKKKSSELETYFNFE